ncbi:MAG TPA: hypothetical protein VJ456_16040 [Acidimicrobiia bacterium]|nr:hypothetical protein [Acidimicrobiia bacterium]
MIRVRRRPLRLGAAVLTLGLLATACGSPSSSAKGQVEESTTTSTIAKGPDSTAAQLRSKLNGLLQENVYLTSAATGAALAGRSDELAGAVAALGGNSQSLTDNVTAIFDAKTGTTFDGLWRKHVDLFVTYAQGRSPQAVSDLTQFTKDFGTFLNSALPSLSADTATGLAANHVQAVKAVVDAQAAGNQTDVYTNERAAAAQTTTMASSLVGAIHQKYPDKIGGDPASKGADLVTTLTVDLRENVFLTCAATGAALGGRNDELTAARAALDNNTAALSDALAGIYGPAVGTTFGPLWAKHIGFLVDYTTAVGAKQQANADMAINNLLQFTQDFGAFINTASPKLSKESAAALAMTHVFTLKDVIDAQAAKNFTKADANERIAGDHMSTVASTFAPLIVAQFPNNY